MAKQNEIKEEEKQPIAPKAEEPKAEAPKAEPEKEEEKKVQEPVKEEEKKEDGAEAKEAEKADETEPKAEEEQPVVQEEVKSNQGRSINDFLLKEEFEERFNALEAKFKAMVDETVKLKEQNAQLLDERDKAQGEVSTLRDKYENHSFGNVGKGGVINPTQKQTGYQSFDDYSRNFM